jgi:hypothetical protein
VLLAGLKATDIDLKVKQRLFSIADIQYRNLTVTVADSIFGSNVLEQGYMFEFLQNFEAFIFERCLFSNNSGYLFNLIP